MPRLRERRHGEDDEGTTCVEDSEAGEGHHVAGTQLPELREDVREYAESPDFGRGRTLGGYVRPPDSAYDYLTGVARAQGRKPSAYLREAGIMTEYDEKQIREWEVPLDDNVG